MGNYKKLNMSAAEIDMLPIKIGNLTLLVTTNKDSLVNAINELNSKRETLAVQVGSNTQAIQGIAATGGASVASAVLFANGQNAEVLVETIEKVVSSALADLDGRISAIEESIKNGFAGLIVDNLSVKVGMKAYMFNGENDDDALVVVRAYAPNFIPKCYAQRWFDTAAKKWYKPTGLSSVNDWVVDN